MIDLRQYARGKPCMVRVPGWCNNEPETTVLAHYRLAGYSGMGLKNADLLGAFACSSCHELVDGQNRNGGLSRSQRELLLAVGVMKTIAYLLERGIVTIANAPQTEADVTHGS